VQNFIECSGSQVTVFTEKNGDNAENNTAITSMGSKKTACFFGKVSTKNRH